MKKNDLVEVKKLEEKVLVTKIKSAKEQIRDLILDKNMNALKDLKAIFKLKKLVALYLTVLRQKQLLRELEAEGGKLQ